MRPIFVWLLLTGGFAAYFAVSLEVCLQVTPRAMGGT